MLGNDRIETPSTEVTSTRRQNGLEKCTWRTHQYFVDFVGFEIHVEISTSNRCHNFHVDLPLKINQISKNIPRGVSTSNRWQIYKDVSIGIGTPTKVAKVEMKTHPATAETQISKCST